MSTDTTEPRRTAAAQLSWITDPHREPITRAVAENVMRLAVAIRPDWAPLHVMEAADQCRDGATVGQFTRAVLHVAETGGFPEEIPSAGEHWAVPVDRITTPDMCRQHPTVERLRCRVCKQDGSRYAGFWDDVAAAKEKAEQERQRLKAAQAADHARQDDLGVPRVRI